MTRDTLSFALQKENLARPLRARRRPPRTERVWADSACGYFETPRLRPFADEPRRTEITDVYGGNGDFSPPRIDATVNNRVLLRFLRYIPFLSVFSHMCFSRSPAYASAPFHLSSFRVARETGLDEAQKCRRAFSEAGRTGTFEPKNRAALPRGNPHRESRERA